MPKHITLKLSDNKKQHDTQTASASNEQLGLEPIEKPRTTLPVLERDTNGTDKKLYKVHGKN